MGTLGRSSSLQCPVSSVQCHCCALSETQSFGGWCRRRPENKSAGGPGGLSHDRRTSIAQHSLVYSRGHESPELRVRLPELWRRIRPTDPTVKEREKKTNLAAAEKMRRKKELEHRIAQAATPAPLSPRRKRSSMKEIVDDDGSIWWP